MDYEALRNIKLEKEKREFYGRIVKEGFDKIKRGSAELHKIIQGTNEDRELRFSEGIKEVDG